PEIAIAPVADTAILPPFPGPVVAVEMKPPVPIASGPASLTKILPPAPDPKVAEEIPPPLRSDRALALHATPLAFPLLACRPFALPIAALESMPPLTIDRLPALTVTVPAFPALPGLV